MLWSCSFQIHQLVCSFHGTWVCRSEQVNHPSILNIFIQSSNVLRCLGLCFPKWNDVLLRRWCYHFVVCIWIYATLLIVPTICEWYGKFGYDKELGKCDYIRTNENKRMPHPRTFFLGISFMLPLLIITGSYTIIWKKAKSRCFLRQSS